MRACQCACVLAQETTTSIKHTHLNGHRYANASNMHLKLWTFILPTHRLLGKPVARFLHPAISNFIQERLEELNSKGQAPSRMENLAKRLEETWGKTYSNIQITSIDSPKIVPLGKATWEPDPKPLMANHPPRVADSNTRISFSQWSLSTGWQWPRMGTDTT